MSHAKFQVSMSIRFETVVFCKILGVGGAGGGGAPYYPFVPQAHFGEILVMIWGYNIGWSWKP